MQGTPVTRTEPKVRDRATNRRKYATSIRRILDRETGKLVGWFYEWNTGAIVPMWKSEPFENVVYV
jgi:hypothetical protein